VTRQATSHVKRNMTSERRQAAQRANSRAARGRKSAAGKAASAQNALRHGLSLPLIADPAASEGIAALARAIAPPAGAGAPHEALPELSELARRIAEAQLELARVLRARHDLIADALAHREDAPSRITGGEAPLAEIVAGIAHKRGRWASLLSHLVVQPQKAPSGPHKLALILGDLAPQLAAMDRYERRARWRRMRAIQAYDERKVYFNFLQSQVVTSRTNPNPDSHRREAPA
jgi:hypothetical protein